MKFLPILILALPVVCLGGEVLNPDFWEETKPWEAIPGSLPPYPKNENLVAFNVSSATANKFMIDTSSLSVGTGYFVATSTEEYDEKIEAMLERKWIEEEDIKAAHIEEYVLGCNYCIHYFFSGVQDQAELLGIDSRYESTIDGLVRVPAKDQLDIGADPSYVITGNHPVVMRESLLPQVFDIGDKITETAKGLIPPGFNGPFCMQTLVNDDLEVVVFEMSARSDGGTNTFMNGSAYSYLIFGEPLSMGRRMSIAIKKGIAEDRLEEIIT